MLATVVHIFRAIHRAAKKTGRGLFMIAEAFDEAHRQSLAAQRRFPFAGE